MTVLYRFDPKLAIDLSGNPVTGAVAYVYDAADTAFATSLGAYDASGVPLNSDGTLVSSPSSAVYPEFWTSVTEVAIRSGDLVTYHASYQGVMDIATAAADAATQAQNAAQDAAAAADASAQSAADAQTPTDQQVDDAVRRAGAVAKWQPDTLFLADQPVVSPSGELVLANANHTSGAVFNAANWHSVRGVANGYAPLDANLQVPENNMPNGYTRAGNKAYRDSLTKVPGLKFMRTDRGNHVQEWDGSAWRYISTPERIFFTGSFPTTTSTSGTLQLGQILLAARNYATKVRGRGQVSLAVSTISTGVKNNRLALSVGMVSSTNAQGRFILPAFVAPGNYYASGIAEIADWVNVASGTAIDARAWLDTVSGTVGVNATSGANENWFYIDVLPQDD